MESINGGAWTDLSGYKNITITGTVTIAYFYVHTSNGIQGIIVDGVNLIDEASERM